MIEVVLRNPKVVTYQAVQLTFDYITSDKFDWAWDWFESVTMSDVRKGDIGWLYLQNDEIVDVFVNDWIVLSCDAEGGITGVEDACNPENFEKTWRKVPVYQKGPKKPTSCYCGECSGSKCLNIPC